jgi:hypothetical protein
MCVYISYVSYQIRSRMDPSPVSTSRNGSFLPIFYFFLLVFFYLFCFSFPPSLFFFCKFSVVHYVYDMNVSLNITFTKKVCMYIRTYVHTWVKLRKSHRLTYLRDAGRGAIQRRNFPPSQRFAAHSVVICMYVCTPTLAPHNMGIITCPFIAASLF